MHSRYVAVRLQTWQDAGRRQVDELLARMGLPLKFCKQDFCALPGACLPHPASIQAKQMLASAWRAL